MLGGKKNSNMSLAMKKYAHTFSIQILQGQNRGDGHMSGPVVWRRGCMCECADVYGRGLFFFFLFFLDDPVFSHPPVCTSAVTIVILMTAPQQKGHVCYPTLLNIHLTERWRGRQSACLTGRRLTAFLSD